jgi:hypothetical protein
MSTAIILIPERITQIPVEALTMLLIIKAITVTKKQFLVTAGAEGTKACPTGICSTYDLVLC